MANYHKTYIEYIKCYQKRSKGSFLLTKFAHVSVQTGASSTGTKPRKATSQQQINNADNVTIKTNTVSTVHTKLKRQ